MTKIYLLLSLSLVFISFSGNAQEAASGIDGMRKNAISLNILGTTPIVGITYDRIVSENVSFEIGAGLPSIGVGMKYFPSGIKESKFLFHLGLTSVFVFSEAFDIWGTSDKSGSFMGYLPIGISYFGEGGFGLGIDLGPAVASEFFPYGNVKVGYRF
ncbi:hypothetical protein ACKGJN_02180 [Gillisia sp. Q332]|uniref:hypothetical protein n=1 Tax=Gillisia xinjiangensis TaxID=3384765 RepID=UPI00391C7F37